MRVPARRATLLVLALLVLAAVAPALAKAPAPGSFKAGGGIAFRFTIHKGRCVSPPKNLNNPKARPGKKAKGLCFNSGDDPAVNMACPQGGSISGAQAIVSAFSRLRLSKSGAMHVKAYTYTSAPDPVGFTELSIKVSGKRATGFVRETDTVYPNGSPSMCDSGKLSFSAHQ
jgi:hypothetical protein